MHKNDAAGKSVLLWHFHGLKSTVLSGNNEDRCRDVLLGGSATSLPPQYHSCVSPYGFHHTHTRHF